MQPTENADGIHYGQRVINFTGYWVMIVFTIIIVWVLFLITFQMRFPPANTSANYLSEMVQLVGYVVSAFVGAITTLLAVFAGSKAKDIMKATAETRQVDQKTMQANRESVVKSHIDEIQESPDVDEDTK